MACQAETAQLVPVGTSVVHSAEALTLRDMLVAAGTMENGGVKGLAWRASTVLQAERWLCAQCDVAFIHSVSSCPTCQVTSASMQLVANNDLLARSLETANSCAYGRQLRFLQDRQQHDGVIPSLGRFEDDDYDDLVEQSIDLSPGVWNVWQRLAASGRRLAGVWQASGRLDVWASGARLGTSGASGLVPCSHDVWARLVTSGHVWARLDVWNVWNVWCV